MFKGQINRVKSEQESQGRSANESRSTHRSTASRDPINNNSTITKLVDLKTDVISIEKPTSSTSDTQSAPVEPKLPLETPISHKLDDLSKSVELLQNIEELRREIVRLNDQLRTVIKEKDESNDQNAQLYQLIEKLRRNLETEKEINSSLQNKLAETGGALKEKTEILEGMKVKTSGSISIKSFDTLSLDSTTGESVEVLNQRVNILQNQLLEKNRQLKIRQQNINDIKKTLQKEMTEHGKTQDELNKLKDQIKNSDKIQSAIHEGATIQNGSTTSDRELSNNIGLIVDDRQSGSQSSFHDKEENKSTVAALPDTISILSKSSASVDEHESNDLQQSSSNRVNVEYLRNVLYRYMTTSDTETAQHLVKALSVLMDFTPEQSAAVKSAMYNRSSWLRLK